jgi:hypothetical protein
MSVLAADRTGRHCRSSLGLDTRRRHAYRDDPLEYRCAPADAPVVSCYEAGRDGFWVHRALLTFGVENIVVDSASIQENRPKWPRLVSPAS